MYIVSKPCEHILQHFFKSKFVYFADLFFPFISLILFFCLFYLFLLLFTLADLLINSILFNSFLLIFQYFLFVFNFHSLIFKYPVFFGKLNLFINLFCLIPYFIYFDCSVYFLDTHMNKLQCIQWQSRNNFKTKLNGHTSTNHIKISIWMPFWFLDLFRDKFVFLEEI